jgi:hypothetical protein
MTFNLEFTFAEAHMPAVKSALGELPSKIFFDIATANAQRDMEEATDLILSVSSGDIAVRVRRHKFICGVYADKPDWSIRIKNKGCKTEIDKLKEGFARWYFLGFSLDDRSILADWYLLDMDRIRRNNLMTRDYPVHDNYDGTVGKYIPVRVLSFNLCVVSEMKKG